MSVKATKTQEEYLKEQLEKGKKTVEDEIAKGREEDTALKEQTHSILDQSAKSAAAVYEQDIAQAPLDSRAQYDKNAMTEAVNRKKIDESLANMGMTDSGISSSMNTALTIQKSNADHEVRVAEQQRIRAAESAIDQIWADNESQKAQQDLSIDTAASERNRALRQNMEAQAAANATALYNQDLQTQTDAYVAEQQAAADAYAAKLKAEQDVINKRASMAQSYIKSGMSASEAWGQAYYAYPDGESAEGVRYAFYNQLIADGYGDKVADAMSKAYARTAGTGAKGTDVSQALTDAMWQVVGDPSDVSGLRATAKNIASMDTFVTEFMKYYENSGLPTADAAYATAIRIGSLYAPVVLSGDDATLNRVGQALARCFSGDDLKTALYYAYLEEEGG